MLKGSCNLALSTSKERAPANGPSDQARTPLDCKLEKKMSPCCFLLPISPTAAGAELLLQVLRVGFCPWGFSWGTGTSQLQRAASPWLGREKGKGTKCAGLAWSPGPSEQPFHQENKGCFEMDAWPGRLPAEQETKAGNTNAAGRGEPRMPACLCGRESALPWRHGGQTGARRNLCWDGLGTAGDAGAERQGH